MERGGRRGYSPRVAAYDRERTIAAARSIISGGGWCVVEACADVPSQQWQVCVLIFDLVPEIVADVVEEEIEFEPDLDVRLTGCDRSTLQPEPALGAMLCYIADSPRPAVASAQTSP